MSSKRQDKNIEPKPLEKWQWVGILLLVFTVSGIIGWVWEFILMQIFGGPGLYVNGGNFLPWMNIYGYGALLILLTCYKLRNRPWFVFLVGALVTGLLELFAGWIVYTVGNGTRYWDYSTSIFGIGHINGFVCPISASVFGLGALLLLYVLMPILTKLSRRFTKRAFLALAISLFTIFIVDDIVNLTLKNLNLKTAQDFYLEHGWVMYEE